MSQTINEEEVEAPDSLKDSDYDVVGEEEEEEVAVDEDLDIKNEEKQEEEETEEA